MKTTKYTMILTIGIICILVTIVLVGCSSRATSSGNEYVAEEPQNRNTTSDEMLLYNMNEEGESLVESADTPPSKATPVDNRKLIKTLNISMQTMKFDETTSSITDLVNELDGYVEESNVTGNSITPAGSNRENFYNPRSASFVLRIPVEKLDTASDKLNNLGNITSRTESVEDVTANYTDTERRLETLKVQEERLLDMLKNADELEYMITLERELSDVRYEIESYTSHLNGLDNQISYSFVYVYVDEVIEYDDVRIAPPTFGERIAKGFSSSVQAISDFGQVLAVILVTVVPFVVVWGGIFTLIIVGFVKCKRRYRQKHPKVLPTQAKSEDTPKVKLEKIDTKK